MLAVCDVYDALAPTASTAKRRHERAIGLLRDEAGAKFDAKCVEALSRVLARQAAAGSLVAV